MSGISAKDGFFFGLNKVSILETDSEKSSAMVLHNRLMSESKSYCPFCDLGVPVKLVTKEPNKSPRATREPNRKERRRTKI